MLRIPFVVSKTPTCRAFQRGETDQRTKGEGYGRTCTVYTYVHGVSGKTSLTRNA